MQIRIDIDDGQVGHEECMKICKQIDELILKDNFTKLELEFVNADEEMVRKLLDWYLEHQDIGLQFHIDSEEQ